MAVRRTRPAVQPPTPSAMPEVLRERPLVEDWVSVDEIAVVRAKLAGDTVNGRIMADDVGEVSWNLQMLARNRHRAARLQWASAYGYGGKLPVAGWPDYRDETVWLTEIRRAIAGRHG